MKRIERVVVIAGVMSWYLLAYLAVRPLANAPVVDSWIYTHAVRVLETTGKLRFIGFTQAMPIAQVIYGAAWSRLFGASSGSLELSVACLGALGGMALYVLLKRCGAGGVEAGIAAAMLIANPCYLFLSFSFMTRRALGARPP